MIPGFRGARLSPEHKEALWDRFFTGAPRPRTPSEQRYELTQASIAQLSRTHGLNPKTVAKWKRRTSVEDRRTGPREPRSSSLTAEQEAVVVAFRRHTLLPLDDCLYALQATIPHLTRSSLHRCLSRHGISRLPEVDGDKPARRKFKRYPIGYFHIDIAEVRTEEGKLSLFVAVDRTSKFAFARLVERAGKMAAAQFLRDLVAAVPYRIHTVLTDNGIQFTNRAKDAHAFAHIFGRLSQRARHRASPDQGEPPMDRRPGRAHEPDHQRGHHPALSLRRP